MCYSFHTYFRRWLGFLVGNLSLWIGSLSSVAVAGGVSLAWDANAEPDIAGYRVHYGTTSGVYTETIDVGNHIEAEVLNLSENITYFFAVTAYNPAALESAPSSEVTVTMAPPLPSTFGGTYSGALVAAADATSAFAELSINKARRFTGRVIVGNFSTTVSGTFNAAGKATVKLLLPLPTPWKFTFQLNEGSGSMDVHLVRGNVDVPLKLTSTPYSGVQLAPQAGIYTVRVGALASTVPVFGAPGEGGYAVITITPAGRVRTVGRLSDGNAFTSSCYLNTDGQFLVHSPLYGNSGGILAGGLFIRETAGVSDGEGVLQWRKPVAPTERFYKQGFDGTVPVLLSRFQRISSLQTLNGGRLTSPRAMLTGGGLPQAPAIDRELGFFRGNAVTVMNSGNERLRLQIRGSNGLITGTFIHPGDGKLRSIAGVLFQKQGAGTGFFPGVQTTGSIQLTGIGTLTAQ